MDLIDEIHSIPERARIVRKGQKEACAISFAKRGDNTLFAIAYSITRFVVEKIVKAIMDIQTQQSKDNPILSILKKEKKQVDASLANLLKAIEQGVVSRTTASRLQELESEQEELERKILTEESKSSMMLEKKR